MAKCPSCGGELHPQENGLWKCAECGKLFRMKQKTPPESDMNAGAPQAQTPPASERNVTEPPVQTEPSAPADEAQTAEREELAMLRARIAAMEAKQAELERGATAKQRESGAGAAVLSFLKKWGFKVVLPVGLLLIALITLLVCFCGVRGIYVNIDDPNEFYSFDATNYEYHGILMGEEYVDKGTWKKSGGQLELTYKDEDFGKVTESYDFSSIDSNNTIFISDDFGNKVEFKRVSLLSYGTSQKIKITLDGNGGSGGDSHKVQIGSKIQEPAEPARDGYMFMGWYTSKEGWKNAEAKRIDFDDRVWEDVTYYANWKNTTQFDLTGDGLDEPIQFTEGDDVESLYMSARGWNSFPEGVTGLVFKDTSGNEIDPSSAPAGNVTVTVISDYLIENGVLKYVKPSVNEFVIPDSVTSIGEYVFRDCDSLTSVTIPDSVTSIGYRAFYYCSAITSVTIPDSVTSIGEDAFEGCSSLGSVTIGNGVTSIGSHAFYNCTSLTSVTIGNGVTSIGRSAFEDCAAEIIWGGTPAITEIGNFAFAGYAGTSITIPDSVTSIGYAAFHRCSGLTSITIPDSVAGIGSRAFEDCYSLVAVHITDIGKWAAIDFAGYDANPLYYAGNLYLNGELVTDLAIPDGVTNIGDYAFARYAGTSITIPDSVTSIGSSAFSGCAAEIIWGDAPTITVIGDYAFAGYAGTSITIPDSVTSIGRSAFYGCSSLTSVTIPDSVTSIGWYAFYYCSAITSVTIPDSVTSIGEYAFYSCDSLTSVTIGNGVTSIGNYAFYGCSGLTSVTIPDSVTRIGQSAFYGCSRLTSIYYTGDMTSWLGKSWHSEVMMASGRTLYLDGNKVEGELVIPDGTTSIPSYAFAYQEDIASVTIPDSVTSIGKSAFYGCTDVIEIENGVSYVDGWAISFDESIYSVELRDGTRGIADYAFAYCDGLTSITIPNSVTSIGGYAFDGCTAEIIWDGTPTITEIGDYAFAGYAGTSITIPNSVTSIGDYAFARYAGTSITIPDSVTSIGSSAFSYCDSLTSVTIPNSVTSIGGWAFYNCDSLTSITIPDSVTSIGSWAFSYCDSLTSVIFKETAGWYRASSSTATSGTSLSSSSLANSATAAKWLTSAYGDYYWKRNV